MIAGLASCVDTSTAEDYLANYENIHHAVETTAAPTVAPTTPEGFTSMPVVESVMRVGHRTEKTEEATNEYEVVIIAGTCENDSVVYFEGASTVPTSVKSVGNSFIAEVKLTAQSDVFVSVMAKSGSLKTSEANTVKVTYDGTAEKRVDGKTMVVGNDSWLFFDSEINDFSAPSLYYESRMANFTKAVNDRISIVNKSGDTEFIFVLVPSRLTMYPEKSPVQMTTANTRYTQVAQALKNSSATVIDCLDLFKKVEGSAEYDLYYRTDSNWSEYAGFLAYTELMNYISGNETLLEYAKEEAPELTAVLTEAVTGTSGAAETTAAETTAASSEAAKELQELDEKKTTAATETGILTDGALSTSASGAETSATEAPTTTTEAQNVYKVDGKFPSAAPLSLDAFNAVTVSGLGGDILSYNGISRDLITEDFVRFAAKDAKLFAIGSETFEPKASGDDPIVTPDISGVKKYVSDKDSMYYVGTGAQGAETGTNESIGFRTGRPELPSALIMKDDSIAPIFDLVAERFNNSIFFANGNYEFNESRAKSYAGSAGNDLVDYVIYFVSEESIDSLTTGLK